MLNECHDCSMVQNLVGVRCKVVSLNLDQITGLTTCVVIRIRKKKKKDSQEHSEFLKNC